MKKKLLILPLLGAEFAVETYPQKLNVISVERTRPVKSELCKHHLHLRIDDIDQDEHKDLIGLNQYKFATKEDILEALDFDKKYKTHIVHCHAGISRSPAIGYAILRGRGMSEEEAMKEVMEIVPQALPNKWIVKLTNEIFS